MMLSGSNSYTGATTINGGTLQVDGSIGWSELPPARTTATRSPASAPLAIPRVNASGHVRTGRTRSTRHCDDGLRQSRLIRRDLSGAAESVGLHDRHLRRARYNQPALEPELRIDRRAVEPSGCAGRWRRQPSKRGQCDQQLLQRRRPADAELPDHLRLLRRQSRHCAQSVVR